MRKSLPEFVKSINYEKADYFKGLGFYLIACFYSLSWRKMGDEFPPSDKTIEEIKAYLYQIYNDRAATIEINKTPDLTVDFYSNGIDYLTKIRVRNRSSFLELIKYCSHMVVLCRSVKDVDAQKRLEILDRFLVTMAYQLIGYWAGKMDAARKNIPGVVARQKKHAEALKEIKKLRKEYGDLKDKKSKSEFRTKAMQLTGITTERSITNYLKIIEQME